MSEREKSKPCITWTKPLPSSPSRFAAGTRTLSKKIEPRPIACWPRSENRVVEIPGVSIGTKIAEMPRARSSGSSGAIRPRPPISRRMSGPKAPAVSGAL